MLYTPQNKINTYKSNGLKPWFLHVQKAGLRWSQYQRHIIMLGCAYALATFSWPDEFSIWNTFVTIIIHQMILRKKLFEANIHHTDIIMGPQLNTTRWYSEDARKKIIWSEEIWKTYVFTQLRKISSDVCDICSRIFSKRTHIVLFILDGHTTLVDTQMNANEWSISAVNDKDIHLQYKLLTRLTMGCPAALKLLLKDDTQTVNYHS